MRITGRDLKKIIREEVARAHVGRILNEVQTTDNAPPAETRRVAQIIGDILNRPDVFVTDEIGTPAVNPRYVLELKRALADSPFWTAVLKGYFGLESIRYKIARGSIETVDSLNQILQDLGLGTLEMLIPDKDNQKAFLNAMHSMYGYTSDPEVRDVNRDLEDILRERRRRR
jgi:hypothetical protein